MKTVLLFILTALASCTQVAKQKDNVFVISTVYERKVDSFKAGLLNEPPPHPRMFYKVNHIIVDSTGQLFYYQLEQRGWICGTGYNFDVPAYIGLKPNNLVQIPAESVKDFVRLNILNQDTIDREVCVGLLTDTVVSNGLASLRDILQADTSKARWSIRKATFEEATVLDFKKQQRHYPPVGIIWDSTKIWFMPSSSDFDAPNLVEE